MAGERRDMIPLVEQRGRVRGVLRRQKGTTRLNYEIQLAGSTSVWTLDWDMSLERFWSRVCRPELDPNAMGSSTVQDMAMEACYERNAAYP